MPANGGRGRALIEIAFLPEKEPAFIRRQDVRIAIQRSHALLSDTAQLFDALDARSNFEPIMQSVRDLNKLDDA